MDEQEQEPLQRQLEALRREVRSMRRWVIFTAFAVAIFLFAPKFAAWIAEVTGKFALWLQTSMGPGFEAVISVLSLIAVTTVAALIISRRGGAGNREDSSR